MCPCPNENMVQPNMKKNTLISGCPCHPLIPCEKARQSCCSDQSGSKSYSTFPPSSLLCLYCSFLTLAAGGAVRLESPLAFLLHNKAVTYSILLCPLPSITHLHTSTLSLCSILHRDPEPVCFAGLSGDQYFNINYTHQRVKLIFK